MKSYDVIVVGTGPAGIITAVTSKKQHPDKSILLVGEDKKGLVPCGIPYIFHKLGDVEKNAMGPKPFVDAGGEWIVDAATDIDAEQKILTLASGTQLGFGKLVFATGSRAVVPTFIEGHNLEGVYYVRKNYEYIRMLKEKMDAAQNVVVVGGGFIGAELAEQVFLEGKNVSLVELGEQCFNKAFSGELSTVATRKMRDIGMKVLTGTSVQRIVGTNGQVEKVILSDGSELAADLVVLSIGYRPNTELARKAGVELNSQGAIRVDNYGRSSNRDFWAVGDCASTIGFMTGREDNIMLASTATAEARILGFNLFGIKIKRCFTGTLGVFSTEIGGLTMAAAGVNDTVAREANIDYLRGSFSDVDRHPGTFDDTSELHITLYASRLDASIIGGEVWGGKSAGEIINIISLAIQKKVTVFELVSLQVGSHPLLTPAPTKTVMIKAAEAIIAQL